METDLIFSLTKRQIGCLTEMIASEHFTVLACETCWTRRLDCGAAPSAALFFKIPVPTATSDQDVTHLYFNQMSTFASRGRSM